MPEFHAEAPQATASEGLAHINIKFIYVTVRAIVRTYMFLKKISKFLGFLFFRVFRCFFRFSRVLIGFKNAQSLLF